MHDFLFLTTPATPSKYYSDKSVRISKEINCEFRGLDWLRIIDTQWDTSTSDSITILSTSSSIAVSGIVVRHGRLRGKGSLGLLQRNMCRY
jgi:hypothetical protein